MEATLRKRAVFPISHYWGLLKDLDDSQKLELVTLLLNSVKPSVSKAKQEVNSLKPYTMEELHQMVLEGEQQFAEGMWQDSEEMFRELEEDFARENARMQESV